MTLSFIIFFNLQLNIYSCDHFIHVHMPFLHCKLQKTDCLLWLVMSITSGLPWRVIEWGGILIHNLITYCSVCLCFRWACSQKKHHRCWAREVLSKAMSLIHGKTLLWYVASVYPNWEYVIYCYFTLFFFWNKISKTSTVSLY